MVRAVVFDLDGTLYDYGSCHGRAMDALRRFACGRYGIAADGFDSAFEWAKREVKALLGNTGASHERMLYMQLFLERIGEKPARGALELYDAYWGGMLGMMEPFGYVLPLFERLSGMGIKIAVLTDLTAHIQHEKIRALGLEDYVDVLVTSEEAGIEKPDARMFGRVMEKLGLGAEDMLMVGDSPERDMRGAEQAGIRGILFARENEGDMYAMVMGHIND